MDAPVTAAMLSGAGTVQASSRYHPWNEYPGSAAAVEPTSSVVPLTTSMVRLTVPPPKGHTLYSTVYCFVS